MESLSAANRTFAEELRAWLEANIAAAADEHEWHRRLVAGRWAVPSWPARWGGRDATLPQEVVYNELMAAFDAPVPRNSVALFNIGPMLMGSGTPEQCERYLPKMVDASEIWCQGFSEPEAGSDLAALRTRAEDRGDHWLVNGQKTWTTFGHEADLCLALCRTDPDVPKHKGISALIVDMRHPGVEVRPLREITGDDGFNEIFFTDVEVGKDHVVGPVNAGWQVAMSTLAFERLGTMKLGIQLRKRLEQVIELARSLGRDSDPVVRRRLAAQAVQVDLMQLLTEQALTALRDGRDPGAALPLGKLQWSELMQTLAELALELTGPYAQLYRGSTHEPPGDWAYHTLYSRMTTIGAGTTQVQKNILAYRILGLPREPDTPPSPGTLERPVGELAGLTRRVLAERPDEVADLGLTGILVPEEHGGLGLGYAELGTVLEELGRALHPGPLVPTALHATAALLEAGALDLLPLDTATLATYDAEPTKADTDGRLTGVKLFVPEAEAAELILVTTADGLYVIDPADAEITPLVPLDPSRALAEVRLDATPGQRIGDAAALARAEDRIVAGLVAETVGAAHQALVIANDYAKQRVQFDRPIGSFQAVQHLLADMLRRVELARAGAAAALAAADRGDGGSEGHRAPVDECHRRAVMAKAYAGDALVRVTADAIQVLGGVGFTWEHPAHRYYKRTLALAPGFGTSTERYEQYAELLLQR